MKNKKEIIITFSYYGIGGAQRRAINLANEFVNQDYNVYVLAVLGRDNSIDDENFFDMDKRVKLIIVPEYYEKHRFDKEVDRVYKKNKRQICWLKRLQYVCKFNKKLCQKIGFVINGLRKSLELRSFLCSHMGGTVIHFGFNIFERTYFATKGLRMKTIYAETNASDKYKNERYYYEISKCIKESDALVFQTHEEMLEHQMQNSKKAFVIHNPIRQGLPEIFVGERKHKVVNFCRISRQKNLLLLIKAFEKFHHRYSDYVLEVYADATTQDSLLYKKELETYIREHNLSEFVFILPPCSDIHSKIIDYSMFVSSSDYEGLSNSMLEAMAIGLPCVCTDCGGGGARELITNGENGILVPCNDVDALANGMKQMISENGLLKKCSENASLTRYELAINNVSKKWLNVIEYLN